MFPQTIAGGDDDMQQTFTNTLGTTTPYMVEKVIEAIKAVNESRWERLLLLLEYIEDQGKVLTEVLLSVCLSVSRSVCLSVSVCLCLSVCLSVSLCPPVCPPSPLVTSKPLRLWLPN